MGNGNGRGYLATWLLHNLSVAERQAVTESEWEQLKLVTRNSRGVWREHSSRSCPATGSPTRSSRRSLTPPWSPTTAAVDDYLPGRCRCLRGPGRAARRRLLDTRRREPPSRNGGGLMSGSERFAFKRFTDVPRQCAVCGRRLRVVDVGRVHSSITYGDGLGVATKPSAARAPERVDGVIDPRVRRGEGVESGPPVNDPAPLARPGSRQREGESRCRTHRTHGRGAGFRRTRAGTGDEGQDLSGLARRWRSGEVPPVDAVVGQHAEHARHLRDRALPALAYDFAHFTTLDEFTTEVLRDFLDEHWGDVGAGDPTQPARDREVVLPLVRSTSAASR